MFWCHINILWYSMTELTRSTFKVSCWFDCKIYCLHDSPFLLHHQVLHLTSSSFNTLSVDIPGPSWEETRATVEGGGDRNDGGGRKGPALLNGTEVHKVSRVLQAEMPHSVTAAHCVTSSCPPQDDSVCLCSIVISKVCRTLPHAQYEPHLQSIYLTVIQLF